MKAGDLVKDTRTGELGLFVGTRIFKSSVNSSWDYECAEVMWLYKTAPNGDVVSTIQKESIMAVK
jgi:hypothetical protein